LKKQLSDVAILEKYREVFQRFAKDGIIDMDKRLKHPFSYQIQRLEDVVQRLGGVVPPNRQSVYYITFFRKGSGEKSIGLYNFPLVDDTLFVIPQRVIHSSRYTSPKCRGYVLNFKVEFFLNNAFPRQHIMDKKVFKASLRPYLIVAPAQRKKLETIFGQLLEEHGAAKLARQEMIALKILELLILCDRWFTDAEAIGKEAIYNPTIGRFNELVESHFTNQRSVRFYADLLHIHPAHLNALMKRYNGLSAKKSIDNRLMLEAESLLAASSLSVKEIAHTLGFSNTDYFSDFFRTRARSTPTAYRRVTGAGETGGAGL
jgi:AraC family transcriptional activator of pobA